MFGQIRCDCGKNYYKYENFLQENYSHLREYFPSLSLKIFMPLNPCKYRDSAFSCTRFPHRFLKIFFYQMHISSVFIA